VPFHAPFFLPGQDGARASSSVSFKERTLPQNRGRFRGQGHH
jgi:hypothetical protein